MLDGEVGGIAGMGEILIAPLHLPLLAVTRDVGPIGLWLGFATSPRAVSRFAAARRLAFTCLPRLLVAIARLFSRAGLLPLVCSRILSVPGRSWLTVGGLTGFRSGLLTSGVVTRRLFPSGLTAWLTVLTSRLTFRPRLTTRSWLAGLPLIAGSLLPALPLLATLALLAAFARLLTTLAWVLTAFVWALSTFVWALSAFASLLASITRLTTGLLPALLPALPLLAARLLAAGLTATWLLTAFALLARLRLAPRLLAPRLATSRLTARAATPWLAATRLRTTVAGGAAVFATRLTVGARRPIFLLLAVVLLTVLGLTAVLCLLATISLLLLPVLKNPLHGLAVVCAVGGNRVSWRLFFLTTALLPARLLRLLPALLRPRPLSSLLLARRLAIARLLPAWVRAIAVAFLTRLLAALLVTPWWAVLLLGTFLLSGLATRVTGLALTLPALVW
jgi:hypothetical protein